MSWNVFDRAARARQASADRLIAEGGRAETAGDIRLACERYREAVRAAPTYAKAHLYHGTGLEAAGDVAGAAACYETALSLDPGNPFAHYNLGNLLFARGLHAEAERHLHAALARKPEFPEAHVVLANLHDAKGDHAAAAASLEAALAQRPDYAGAWYNYALVLTKLDRPRDAEAAVRRALELDPGHAPAYRVLGDLLRGEGRLEEALEVIGQARMRTGGGLDWDQAELHVLNYYDGVSEETLFAKHREVGARIEATHPARFAPFANTPDPERRLRIGYVSRDLYRHPVALFLIPLLERHDRSQVEVFCYSTGETADDVTAQLRSLSDHWREAAKLPEDGLAEAIHRDCIDVLVDLLGHGVGSVLAAFAQQPAPVQMTWLGYLNSTGLTRIRYRLTDRYCDPPGPADRLHTETLVRLPHSQWCYRPFLSAAHAAEPPCTAKGFVTFGSVNHVAKLTATTRGLWARILGALPDSRLLVLGVRDGPAAQRLRKDLAAGGVAPSRITVVPPLPLDAYFRRFDDIDLALDATPYSGGTTTCDTLWMGVPVVTLSGSRSASRSAASILATAGLGDWIAQSPDDYVRLALQHARNRPRLAELRATLRRQMLASPLMDEARFARDVEEAYRRVWRTWCAGSKD